MTDDELLRRMQAADPARERSPADSWITDLTEATMNASEEPRLRQRRRLPALVAAASITALGIGAYTVLDQPLEKTTTKPTSISLEMPAQGTSMTSCIAFSIEVLGDMQLAFSGTVDEVRDDSVTLDVDHWYTGGTADQVVLAQDGGDTVSIDGIVFTERERYLITATDGRVNFCGYSVPWSDEAAADFREAFGG